MLLTFLLGVYMKNLLRTSLLISTVCLATMISCKKPADLVEAEKEIEPEKEIVDTITESNTGIVQGTDPVFLKRYVNVGSISGEISKSPADSPLLPWLQKEVAPFYPGNLNTAGSIAPLLAFGDGMSAGWTDGGLYRAGQQVAFPNLVAHQMALKDFKSPLFSLEHGNGTGYLVLNTKAGAPVWSEVSNNLAILSRSNVPELAPYLGGDVENMSEPKVDQGGISGTLSPKENGWTYGNSGQGWTDDMIFFWRMQPNADKHKDSYWDMLNKNLTTKKPAVVLASFGFDLWLEQNLKNDAEMLDWRTSSSETSALAIGVGQLAQKAGAQGIIYTLPAFKHLAYYEWIRQYSTPFYPEREDWGTPAATNKRIRQEANEKKLLIVDLEVLYAKIHTGNYVSDDGFKITGKPGGNFFSSDGIYPSAIGNAVIANETIKVINAKFKSRIPLINLTEFASYIK